MEGIRRTIWKYVRFRYIECPETDVRQNMMLKRLTLANLAAIIDGTPFAVPIIIQAVTFLEFHLTE